MKKKVVILAALASALALAGCKSFPTQAPAEVTSRAAVSASTTGAVAGATASGQALGAAQQAPSAGPGSTYASRTIYFDFNKSVVKPEYFQLLKKQAQYLSTHTHAKVLLAGYTDDRGTWEYNIALGARRAAAVRQFLMLQGVNSGQIQTISYGEAYPADPQNNEVAWAKNRRVAINFISGKQ